MIFTSGRRRRTAAVLVIASVAAGQAAASDCPSTPPAVRDIKAMGYYSDAAKSVVDAAKFKANLALTAPLNDFNTRVAGMSDTYLAHGDVAAGACAVAWLEGWARDGALLGDMVRVNNDQPDYLRQWAHAGAAIAYLKVKPAAPAPRRARIEAWLKAVAASSLAYWDTPRRARNNHYYWTGVGVMATAIAGGDPQLFDRAKAIYRRGVDDIGDDGALPLEMARGERAFHYHNYALDPLVLMAEMARRQGEDWYGYRNHRIDLLAERVAAGYADPSWFAQHAGKPQAPQDAKPTGETGWVEFYRLRAAHPERFEALHAAGPYDDPRAGGDLTLMAKQGLFDAR
jgi:poly(beta-D-mannuronate) lyase